MRNQSRHDERQTERETNLIFNRRQRAQKIEIHMYVYYAIRLKNILLPPKCKMKRMRNQSRHVERQTKRGANLIFNRRQRAQKIEIHMYVYYAIRLKIQMI